MPSPEQGGEWGILGGSFDPVHKGHLNLAASICRKKRLSGVLIVPAFRHPLKQDSCVASYADRAAMLKLALADYSELQLCEIENEKKLPGYTIDTLEALKKRFPKAKFYFIIGADLVTQLKDWYRAEDLLMQTNFLIGSRPGAPLQNRGTDVNRKLEFVEINELDISASDIRLKIKRGALIGEIKKLVPHNVADYIFQKELYR